MGLIEELLDRADEPPEGEIAHYGVRGMKWGIRKRRSSVSSVTKPENVTLRLEPGKRVKAKGGSGFSPSEDAKMAAAYARIAMKSSPDALSNKQLQALLTRADLEQRYAKIANSDAHKPIARQFLEKFAKSEVSKIASGKEPTTLAVAKILSGQSGTGGKHRKLPRKK